MTAPETKQDNVNPVDIRNRSRVAGFDLLKSTVGLASGGVGVFFATLTKDSQGFSEAEKTALIFTIIFMVFSVLAGLLAWAADAAFYKRWADVLRNKPGSSWEAREVAKIWRSRLITILVCSFALGIIAAGVFGILRA